MLLVNKSLIFIIRFYQFVFSFKRPCCRFMPTCSKYAIEAIEKYGAYKGAILAIKRILKCRPHFKKYTNFGYDPVP